MTEKAMYKGFDPEKQARQEAWLVERFGPGVQRQIDAAKEAQKDWTQAEFDASQAELAEIEAGFARSLAAGLPADSAAVQALARRHRDWVARSWRQPMSRQAYENLAGLYGDHPDFRARYEAQATGMTEYLQAAMRTFAQRELA